MMWMHVLLASMHTNNVYVVLATLEYELVVLILAYAYYLHALAMHIMHTVHSTSRTLVGVHTHV